MKKTAFITYFWILICSCSFDSADPKKELIEVESQMALSSDSNHTTENVISLNYLDSTNYTDNEGLKQGKWIRKWKGKVIEVKTYKNDTLDGFYSNQDGMIAEGNYRNGKREGFFYSYYGKRESIAMVHYYENDSTIWAGFPAANQDFLSPIKDFYVNRDSVYIKAPHINGNTWYEGNFYRKNNFLGRSVVPIRYGIHKIYHLNGKIKGIIDYEKELVQEYDSLGNLLYKAKFAEQEIHNQPTLNQK